MEKKKKLQLRKETIATLDDKSQFGIFGGNAEEEEEDGGIKVETAVRTQCIKCETVGPGCPTKFPDCKQTIDPGPSCQECR